MISEVLTRYNIKHSLSKKGCPYDNAVSEATFKTIKTELVYANTFDTLVQLKQQFAAYVYWYNHIRMHSSLGYISPVMFKTNANKDYFKKVVSILVAFPDTNFNDFLIEWDEMRKKHFREEITDDEYQDWKFSYPKKSRFLNTKK